MFFKQTGKMKVVPDDLHFFPGVRKITIEKQTIVTRKKSHVAGMVREINHLNFLPESR